MRGVFESTTDLITYRYMGCSSEVVDRDHARGHMTIRRDMRLPGGGLRASPLTIAMLDTAGISIDPQYHAACTHIEVHLLDPGIDVTEVQIDGTVRRVARTAIFTEARFRDAKRPERIIGMGTVGWSIIGATPPGFTYRHPGPGVPDGPDLPDLATAFGAVLCDEGGPRLEGLSSRVGTEVLHHGPILVMSEAAAAGAVAADHGGGGAWLTTASIRLVRAGRSGPFEARAEACHGVDSLVVLTDMVDVGTGGSTIAAGLFRFATELSN